MNAYITKIPQSFSRTCPWAFINGYFKPDTIINEETLLRYFGCDRHPALDVAIRKIISQNRFDWIEKHYRLFDKEAVRHFINDNTDLATVLEEAYSKIFAIFSATTLTLKVEYDQETDDEVGCLALSIITSLDVNTALDKLDVLDDRWWLNMSSEIRHKVVINVEFR